MSERRFFRFFRKHAEENHLRHEMPPIVAAIIVLKYFIFYFKTTITER